MNKKMRTFLSKDGKSGFALKDDDIVSLFKHSDSKARGVAKTALDLAARNDVQ